MSKKPRFSRKFLNILIIVTALLILLLSSMNPRQEGRPLPEPPASAPKEPGVR